MSPVQPRLLAASLFARRRVLVGCFLLPVTCLLLPVCLVCVWSALSLASGGWPFTTVGMALLCFHQLQPHIPEALRQLAFDDSIYAEKLEQSKTKLPIYSVAAAGMISRFILSPLYCFIFGETTDDGESISWQNGGRARASFLWMGVSVAFGTAVLSLSIVFRYLGPMSISECVCSFLIQYPCIAPPML